MFHSETLSQQSDSVRTASVVTVGWLPSAVLWFCFAHVTLDGAARLLNG